MGLRGPKPTPTAQLRLVGSRELEHRRNEPQPELGAPTPPTWLAREARAEWNRVVPELTRIGVVALVDRAVLTGYVESWSTYVAAQRVVHKGDFDKVAVRALADARGAFLKFAQELGLSPSARVRLTTKASVPSDPLGRFAARKGSDGKG